MESLLERLKSETPTQTRERSEEALEFFLGKVRTLRLTPNRFYKQSDLVKAKRYLEGRMYTFFYNPKTKDKLPYYDTFPVVIINEIYPDGFSALNLHYLPPRYRVKLLSALYDYIVLDDDVEDDSMKTRINMTYNLLNGVSKLRYFKPCYKRYLTTHIEGRALEVIPDYWDIVAMLPVANFQKESIRKVYSDSIRRVNS